MSHSGFAAVEEQKHSITRSSSCAVNAGVEIGFAGRPARSVVKVHYDECLESHIAPESWPESWAVIREGVGEALTGVFTGQPHRPDIEPRKLHLFGCRR